MGDFVHIYKNEQGGFSSGGGGGGIMSVSLSETPITRLIPKVLFCWVSNWRICQFSVNIIRSQCLHKYVILLRWSLKIALMQISY